MTWNHRVIRHTKDCEEPWLAIHEVFYDDNGNPNSCIVDPIKLINEDLESLKWEINKIKECLDKPILDYEYFEELEKGIKNG